MTILNPRLIVVDDNISRFEDMRDVDLLASNVPNVGTGRYVCFEQQVPKGQVLVIGGMAFYAMQRINVGTDDESFEMISPKDGNNCFSFEPQINNAVLQGFVPRINVARRRSLGAPPLVTNLNNNERNSAPGISMLSSEPRNEAQNEWQNALYRFVVPSDAIFRVIFTILPPSATAPLAAAGRYTIGVAATKRVDYAGACIVGQQMAEQTYNALKEQVVREIQGRL